MEFDTSNFLTALTAVVCLVVFAWSLLSKEGIYRFPFYASCVYLGWVLPQMVGLTDDRTLPPGAFDKTAILTILCILACFFGFELNKTPLRKNVREYSKSKLILSCAVVSLVGVVFYSLVMSMAKEATQDFGGAWTGVITVYVFFAKLLWVGLVLAIYTFVKYKNKISLFILAVDMIFILNQVLLQGRRAAMSYAVVILFLGLWFWMGKKINRIIVVCAFVLGTFLVNSIGQYRDITMNSSGMDLSVFSSIEFMGNLKWIVENGGFEFRNAVYDVATVDATENYNYGLSLWNQIIFSFVPGQFIGYEAKESFMFDIDLPVYATYYYTPHPGSTHTGMSDAYASFGVFGFVKFFLIAYIMSRLFHGAKRGDLMAQLYYMLLMTPALHAITHGTDWFFKEAIFVWIFLGMSLFYARKRRQPRSASFGKYANKVWPEQLVFSDHVRPSDRLLTK